MKALHAFLFFLIGPLSLSVDALEMPKGANADRRVKTVVYNEEDVVAIYAYPGVATHGMFSLSEEVLDIASGFSAGWQLSHRRNNLYLKPKSLDASQTGSPDGLSPVPGRWDTNLIVTTNRRVYSFQLVLIGPRVANAKLPQDDRMAFRIKFTYPMDDAALLTQKTDAFTVKNRLAKPAQVKNTRYTMQVGKNSSAIAPQSAYDDGRFTYLRFPNNREIPAIFLVDENHTESLVNAHLENDQVVIQRVAPRLTLRLGRQVVAVFNEAYDIDGVAPADGTAVDGVQRVVLEESK